MSSAVGAAPAWIGATLLWWWMARPSSTMLKDAWSARKSLRHTWGNAKHAVPQANDLHQALVGSGLFSKTDPARLSRWCEQLTPVHFPSRHVVGARGDLGDHLYVIVSGKMKLSNRWLDGSEIALTILGRNQIFGGVSLFDPATCVTRAMALTEVLVVPIERSQLFMWMAECTELSHQMLRLYARRAKEMTETLHDFASADVQSRVASRLLWLKKRFGHRDGEVVRIAHDLTLEDFSGFVGASAVTTGKTLHKFESRGWIRLDDKGVVVVDSHALASVRKESI
jgi:CRP/FNR family transcriptional regulator, cyclic AMP receptor protein